jgi:hypothetical protein
VAISKSRTSVITTIPAKSGGHGIRHDRHAECNGSEDDECFVWDRLPLVVLIETHESFLLVP